MATITIVSGVFTGVNTISIAWTSNLTNSTPGYYQVTYYTQGLVPGSYIVPSDLSTYTCSITDSNGINSGAPCGIQVGAFNPDQSLIAGSTPYIIQNNVSQEASIPCFPKGTRISVPGGTALVEDLKPGDLVRTADGRAVAATVYSRTIETATKETAPYKINRHVFGLTADLCLSPLHAFQSKKGLWQIPKYAAKQSEAIQQYGIGLPVTYYHIECPNFFTDNLLLDGCVVESFGLHQVKKAGITTLYTYNTTLNGFTRASPSSVPKKLTNAVRL